MSHGDEKYVDTAPRRVLSSDANDITVDLVLRKELIDTIKLLEGAKNKLKQLLSR